MAYPLGPGIGRVVIPCPVTVPQAVSIFVWLKPGEDVSTVIQAAFRKAEAR